MNAFQQKHPGEAVPNASMITLLVQRLPDTGLVAGRKPSGRAFVMKTKVKDVETALQRSPLKRPSVYINIITKFISLLRVIKGTLGCITGQFKKETLNIYRGSLMAPGLKLMIRLCRSRVRYHDPKDWQPQSIQLGILNFGQITKSTSELVDNMRTLSPN
ncbi:DUF4817 domain-containing protein [Trichonephila clavipes]|nr:DUF4817 domain-containing protein [Trichonephila clavipes]